MKRYQRQIILPQVGEKGQQKLAEARVLVIGAGGLGCALLPYLAASGIGCIGIVDGDRVAESNLHRQILYTPNSVGQFKAHEAKAFLNKQNPDTQIDSHTYFLEGQNALDLFRNYDLIVDATDRIAVRYLINDAAVLTGKPVVYASIHRFEGQISVFNFKNGPTYRCLFPKAVSAPSCAEAGVLGTAVGLIGMLQAQEVLKVILEIGEILSGTLLVYDTLHSRQHTFSFAKKETPVITAAFYRKTHLNSNMESRPFQFEYLENRILIDVRELDEKPRLIHERILEIPLSTLDQKIADLDKNEAYSVFCQSGKRAIAVASQLKNSGFNQVIALQEGAEKLSEKLKRYKDVKV